MTITRLLIALVVFVAVVVGGMIYYRWRAVSNLNLPALPDVSQSLTGNTVSGRLSTVEDALAVLVNRVNNLSGTTSTTGSPAPVSPDVTSRVQSLENTVANLQVQINQLKSEGTSGTPTTSGKKSPAYIPLGWSGSASTQDWSSVSTQSISIDPADYSGYTSMDFEVNLNVYQGNGKAYARLYDKDDGLAIIPSEVSSTSDTYSWVTSATFQLPSTAKKTYVLQVKTTTGYASQVQNARIKVNF